MLRYLRLYAYFLRFSFSRAMEFRVDFDISNIQGTDSVASMVVWEDGRMKKSDYRKFIIKTVDFALSN